MKKLAITAAFSMTAIVVTSCSDIRKPSSTYMPDMAYSRAYETYADHSNLNTKGIHYTTQPVAGTMQRGAELPYRMTNDSMGYAGSASVASPLAKLGKMEMLEAERLYLINCAICHGTAMDGNGPLYKGGAGPYAAKPANLVGDPKIVALPEGTLFHVMTYGKNLMGSYASQMSRKQRWMVAQYIKSKQTGGVAGAKDAGTDSTAAATAAPAADSASKK